MANVATPIGRLEMDEVKAAARALDLEIIPREIRKAEDIAKLGKLSLSHRVPAIYEHPEFTAAGGLMGYSGDLAEAALGITVPSTLIGADEVIE